MNNNLFITKYSSEESFKNIYKSLSKELKIDWILIDEGPSLYNTNNKINLEEFLLNNNKKFEKIFVSSNCLKIFYWNIIKLKKKTDQLILISFDDEYKFNINYFEAQFFDLIFCTDFISSYKYKYYGLNSYFTCHPVNFIINDENFEDFNDKIMFIGNINDTTDRLEKIKILIKEYKNFKYIDNKGYVNLRLDKSELNKIYRDSNIIMNFSKLDEGRLQKTNLSNDIYIRNLYGFKGRPLEVFASGGFCLSEWSYTLEYIFGEYSNLLLFKNNDEMILKINYFLKNKNENKNLRKKIITKLKKDYSIDNWSKRIFGILKNNHNNNKTKSISYIFPKKILLNHLILVTQHKLSLEKRYLKKIICLFQILYEINVKNCSLSVTLEVFLRLIFKRILY